MEDRANTEEINAERELKLHLKIKGDLLACNQLLLDHHEQTSQIKNETGKLNQLCQVRTTQKLQYYSLITYLVL